MVHLGLEEKGSKGTHPLLAIRRTTRGNVQTNPILSDGSVRSVLNGVEGKAAAVLTREEQQVCEPEGGKRASMSGLSHGTPLALLAFERKGRIGLRIRKLRLQGRLLHKRGAPGFFMWCLQRGQFVYAQ